ncbi:MAG: hypothetical protein ACRCUC_13070 [Aestuariivirga sp.]
MIEGGALTQRWHGTHDGQTVVETIGDASQALHNVRKMRDMGMDRTAADRDMDVRALYCIPPIIWHKLAKESGIPFHQQKELDAYIHQKIMHDSEYSAFRVWDRRL